MKKLLLITFLVLLVFSSCSCFYRQDDMERDIGSSSPPLVKLKEAEYLQGGGNILSWGIQGRSGLLFAIETTDGIILVQAPFSKVRIIFEEVNPNVHIKGKVLRRNGWKLAEIDYRNIPLGERIELFTDEYVLHLPKGSEHDFLMRW